jgi:hypothetical protein
MQTFAPSPCCTCFHLARHTFNFLRHEGWLFCVVAGEDFGRQVPFAFLDRAAEAWVRDGYPKRAEKGAAHSFDRAFGPRLREYMVRVGCVRSCPQTQRLARRLYEQLQGAKQPHPSDPRRST